MKRAAVPVLVSLAACAPARAPEPPPVVVVDVLGAMVAPCKADGAPWDADLGAADMRNTFSEVITFSREAKATPGAWIGAGIRIGATVGAAGMKHASRPDPYGWATLESPGAMPARVELPGVKDEFRAVFAGARFAPTALQDNVRLTVHLTDRDLHTDDEIGTVVLTADDLRNALAIGAGRVVPVPVAEQGTGQIVLVDVAVTRVR